MLKAKRCLYEYYDWIPIKLKACWLAYIWDGNLPLDLGLDLCIDLFSSDLWEEFTAGERRGVQEYSRNCTNKTYPTQEQDFMSYPRKYC